MGYSSRKPYYNLGMSQKEFFGGSSRFLKQSLDKESMFEKPYLDLEYPQMHLRLPEPSWPSMKPLKKGVFGELRRDLRQLYIFPPANCGLADTSSTAWAFHWWNSCGDVTTIEFRAHAWFAAREDWNWIFSLASADIDLNALTVTQDNKSISISTDVPGTYGTVLVCGQGSAGQTPYIFENYYEEGTVRPKLFLGSSLLWNIVAHQGSSVFCCEEIMFDCDSCISDANMAWDYGTSAAIIAQSDTCVIAITGNNSPFDWSVSGTDFTLANSTTTGLTNTLIAGASACGSATVTVTGCDSTVATGYVRCTEGQWTQKSIGVCEISGAATDVTTIAEQVDVYRVDGNKKQYTRFVKSGVSGSGLHDSCATAEAVICNLEVDCLEFTLDCSAFAAAAYPTLCGERTCRTACLEFSGQYYYDCQQAIANQYTYWEWECAP